MSNEAKPEIDPTAIDRVPSGNGEIYEDKGVEHDAVFGAITEDGPNYRNVGWRGTAVLMIKTQIGLGVLSLPAVFDSLGIIPGNILIVVIGAMTTWSNYMIGVFKMRHPDVYGIDDVGQKLFGRVGYELFGAMYWLYFTFVSGSGMLSISISLNALSTHAACTAIFVAVAAIIAFSLSSIQTLGRISWLAWIGSICIITAILVVTVAVGLQDRPAAAPKDTVWKSDYKLVGNPSFTDAISGISTIILSFAGTPAFFNIAAEMRDPKLYTRSLCVCQTVVTSLYIVVGSVVYYYCGSYVSSPALGSAGVLVKKVSYGIALPGLIVSAVLLAHLPAKHAFIRILRGSDHLTSNSLIHWVTWLGSTFTVCMVAYIVASAIPVFSGLVSLIGALLACSLTFQPYGAMYLYDNWHKPKEERTWGWRSMIAWSIFMIVSGTFLTIAGTYGSIVGIIDSYKESGGSAAWTCADNSGST